MICYIAGAGGDGAINEIAGPLIKREDVVIGIIPGSAANDFVQISGFPGRFDDDDRKIFFSGDIIETDAGKVNEMVFLNVMGPGFDALVESENYAGSGEGSPQASFLPPEPLQITDYLMFALKKDLPLSRDSV